MTFLDSPRDAVGVQSKGDTEYDEQTTPLPLGREGPCLLLAPTDFERLPADYPIFRGCSDIVI